MTTYSPMTILRLIGPRVPLIFKTGVLQTLGLTEESSKWDLRTALIVTTLRSIIIDSTSTVTLQQSSSLRDPGIQPNMWIAPVTFPAPEDDIRQLLFRVIDELKTTGAETYTQPSLNSVSAEWTGYRYDARKKGPVSADLSSEEKYKHMMEEVKSNVTVLYFHGGAYFMMDPASHRPVTTTLARLTKGRVLSVRYRLAPQNPFPAALLDCIVAYLSLLYPPEGSLHEPVKPEHVVFAGDSAGGNACLAVLLFLLHLKHTGQTTLRWHGKEVSVPLPAGIAPCSPWADLTHNMPSIATNARYDYLPAYGNPEFSPHKKSSTAPPCDLWPAKPPRAHMFTDGSCLAHPLVSPIGAQPSAWADAPPCHFIYGEEMLLDEGKVMAKRIAGQGSKVQFELYEGMPHVFAPIFQGTPVSSRCFAGWAGWISTVVEEPEKLPTGSILIKAKTLKEEEGRVADLIDMTDAEVDRRMGEGVAKIQRLFEEKHPPQAPETARL